MNLLSTTKKVLLFIAFSTISVLSISCNMAALTGKAVFSDFDYRVTEQFFQPDTSHGMYSFYYSMDNNSFEQVPLKLPADILSTKTAGNLLVLWLECMPHHNKRILENNNNNIIHFLIKQ